MREVGFNLNKKQEPIINGNRNIRNGLIGFASGILLIKNIPKDTKF
jgi:hypothetical protein